ncbi:MAG: MMPL family transporter [Candidatus Nanopelagicales bacterium]|jgi:RND superfamily putative drug exporter
MGALSAWAIRRPVIAILIWVIATVGVGVLAFSFKGTFNDSFSLPNTQSAIAQDLLQEVNPAGADGNTANVVWSPASGSVEAPEVKTEVDGLLTKLAALDGIKCITSPYDDKTYGPDCPKPTSNAMTFPPGTPQDFQDEVNKAFADGTTNVTYPEGTPQSVQDQLNRLLEANKAAKEATSTISADKRVAYATVTFIGAGTAVVSQELAEQFVDVLQATNSSQLQVGATGQILTAAGAGDSASEAVGVVVALIILAIAFGSLIAAGLPILIAVSGLIVGQLLILLISGFLDVASFAPELASMIGLGVGIDYSLFILNRFRQEVLAGAAPKDAIHTATRTAGRAVLFAASTVIMALLGLFVLGVSFFYGLAIAAAVTVFVIMLAALFLLPAVASLLGRHTIGLRLPWARHPKVKPLDQSAWASYGSFLQRAPWLFALLALGLVGVLAIPAFSLRQGFPDNGSAQPGTPARVGFDLMAEGFGPGVNGPFFVAVTLPTPLDDTALRTTVRDLAQTEGVALTLPNEDMLPLYEEVKIGDTKGLFSDNGIVTSVLVQPTTAPDDPATNQLLERLRTQTASTVAASGAAIYVGGTQAVTQDFTDVLISVLPLFLLIVIGLGFLALFLLFRSLVIPLTAAVTSLLSFAAALGVTVAVFQWGWGASLIGVSTTGPILPFLPIMVFAILFGLSMDYEVFLVSRMQEGWHETGDNREAVRHGLAGSGRVVVAAALIMSSVFLAFVPMPNDTIKLFGLALASAILVDAFIVRLILIPSVMSMLGRSNWWLPGWLRRHLPNFSVE